MQASHCEACITSCRHRRRTLFVPFEEPKDVKIDDAGLDAKAGELGVCAAELQSVFFSRTIGEPRGAARD
ncbi:hypothetical protein C664_16435 [Thauera sp. 63]|nr:hypothetical protein C664_16435 [Thauera sp. 63]